MKIKKETLILRKEAFEIMLKGARRRRDGMVVDGVCFSGLCSMATCLLDIKAERAFMTVLKRYGKSIGRDANYAWLWPAGEWKPRRQWLEQELEKINKELEAYDVHD